MDAFVVYRYESSHETYAPLLDFAARQPQFCRSIELLAQRALGGDSRANDSLLESVREYEETLGRIENGDRVESGALEPPETIATALGKHTAVWNELKPLFDDILDSRRQTIPLSATAEIARGMARLLQSSFDVVDAVERWRDDERLKMIRRVTAVSLAGLLALLLALKIAWDRVVLPMRDLRERALGFGTRAQDEVPANEIDAVAEALTDMSSIMSRLRQEQTRIKAELRRAETDYQSIFDNAVAGILRTDANGKPLLANRALARMLGYSCPGELLEVLDDVHRQLFVDGNHRSRFERLHREHGHVELETKARRRDGSTVSVLESARSAEAGKSLVYDMVIVDVTPLKKAQESLRNLSGRLLRSQDEERRRIARELHDSTGQLLAALGMNLGRIDKLLPELRDSVAGSVELAEDCSRQLRSMSYLLHPPMLEEMGLVYALQAFVKGFSARSGIRVELDAPPTIERMDADAELTLFRVAQEALTNVQRHAESSDAIIRLRATEAEIRLEIEDHGRGLDEDLLGSNGDSRLANMGVGVRGMEERLRQFLGRLSIESARGRTVVRAELPLSKTLAPAEIPKR